MTLPAGPRPSDKYIPWYIVLFFVVQASVLGWFCYLADSTYTGLVTEQAYEKGLKYNQTIARYEAQQKLGWTSVIAQKDGGIEMMLSATDKKPVTGAQAQLWLVRPVRAGADQRLTMTETAPGRYFAVVAPPEKGLWEARISVEKEGQSFQASRRVEF